MTDSTPEASVLSFANIPLPRIVFVLGKGGVGRSTIAAALGVWRAGRGERVLVLEWAVADCIGPWLGAPPAGPTPVAVTPWLSLCNFGLDEALRAYFVDHLHMRFIYRHVIQSSAVARVLEVAPGIAEMLFLGQLWWLITLAEKEAGLRFDRIVVDAPATGHGASLLDVPTTLSSMGASKLLAVESQRVAELMADPLRTGVVVVSLAEPLVVDETMELVPRVSDRLGRPPIALFVNRSATTFVGAEEHPSWLKELGARLSPNSGHAIEALFGELHSRNDVERELRGHVQSAIASPIIAVAEMAGRTPLDVVNSIARALGVSG